MSSIEERLDRLERRARYYDALDEWRVKTFPFKTVDEKGAELRAKHGVRPIPERGEGVRWFRWDSGSSGLLVGEFPSMKLYGADGSDLGKHCWPRMDRGYGITRDTIELDGPPPHGKPLAAQPATGGDGMEDSEHKRLSLYPSRMSKMTREAFEWIQRHDGGAHGALFTRTLSDACAEYAASEVSRAIAAKDAEIERLNALVNKLDASV